MTRNSSSSPTSTAMIGSILKIRRSGLRWSSVRSRSRGRRGRLQPHLPLGRLVVLIRRWSISRTRARQSTRFFTRIDATLPDSHQSLHPAAMLTVKDSVFSLRSIGTVFTWWGNQGWLRLGTVGSGSIVLGRRGLFCAAVRVVQASLLVLTGKPLLSQERPRTPKCQHYAFS
jgi:hypothetical protein